MDISKRIRQIREEKGLTQEYVADKMGLEQPNYGRYERKGDKLTIEQLKQIASALGVSLKELLFDEKATKEDREFELLEREKNLLEREFITMRAERGILSDFIKRFIIFLIEESKLGFSIGSLDFYPEFNDDAIEKSNGKILVTDTPLDCITVSIKKDNEDYDFTIIMTPKDNKQITLANHMVDDWEISIMGLLRLTVLLPKSFTKKKDKNLP